MLLKYATNIIKWAISHLFSIHLAVGNCENYILRSLYLRHSSPIFLVGVSQLSRFSRFSRHRVLKQRTTLANNYFAFYYPPREGSSYRITSVTLASVHSFIWLASKENGSFVLTSSFSVILMINRHAKYVTDFKCKNIST